MDSRQRSILQLPLVPMSTSMNGNWCFFGLSLTLSGRWTDIDRSRRRCHQKSPGSLLDVLVFVLDASAAVRLERVQHLNSKDFAIFAKCSQQAQREGCMAVPGVSRFRSFEARATTPKREKAGAGAPERERRCRATLAATALHRTATALFRRAGLWASLPRPQTLAAWQPGSRVEDLPMPCEVMHLSTLRRAPKYSFRGARDRLGALSTDHTNKHSMLQV